MKLLKINFLKNLKSSIIISWVCPINPQTLCLIKYELDIKLFVFDK